MLLILGGLPGVGKTSIARDAAVRLMATHVRIDSIEQALRTAGAVTGDMGPAGYEVGYAVAADNLAARHTVIADSVNPIAVTRAAWRSVAERLGRRWVEIEVRCSDPHEHRRRVETRVGDIPNLRLPSWEDVLARTYEPWDADIVLDTARMSLDECSDRIAGIFR